MHNCKDLLEIFVLTYNRSEYLNQTIQGFLEQTEKNIKITVVDNASTDDTELLVKKYQGNNSNIHYYKQQKNVGFMGNLDTAIQLAQAKYVMLFHDDDIIHPQYIETALKLINRNMNIDIISCKKFTFNNDKINSKNYKNATCKVFKNKIDYYSFIYINKWGEDLCCPSVIYKTSNLKKVDTNDLKKYEKICDKPLALSTINDGVCVFVNQPMINYREHDGQDTFAQNSISDNAIINHNIFFKNILQHNLLSKFIFDTYSYYWIESLNTWTGRTEKLSDCLKNLYVNNAISYYVYLYKYQVYKKLLLPINYLIKKILRVLIKHKTTEISINLN